MDVVVALSKPAPPGTRNYYHPTTAIAIAGVDEDGWYSFTSPVAPGDYVLLVWERWRLQLAGSSFAPARLGLLPLSVPAGDSLPPVEIVLP
jgi:hypothetical protein